MELDMINVAQLNWAGNFYLTKPKGKKKVERKIARDQGPR
jgi:hypothetical protein